MHWDARFDRLQIGQIIRHVRIFSGSKDCVRREVKRAFSRDLKRDVRSEERISRGRAFHRKQTRTKYDSQWVEVRAPMRRMSSPVDPRRVEGRENWIVSEMSRCISPLIHRKRKGRSKYSRKYERGKRLSFNKKALFAVNFQATQDVTCGSSLHCRQGAHQVKWAKRSRSPHLAGISQVRSHEWDVERNWSTIKWHG